MSCPAVRPTLVRPLFITLLSALSLPLAAQSNEHQVAKDRVLEELTVEGQRVENPLTSAGLREQLERAGVGFFQSGGLAPLPVVNGLNDERVKVTLDGAELTSACANHMNPVLSYANTQMLAATEVVAGITPVSMGGDSIAGTITLKSRAPRFNEQGSGWIVGGQFDALGASNDNLQRYQWMLESGNDQWSFRYNGSFEDADSYDDGNGDKVLDTLYRARTHHVSGAWRGDDKRAQLRYSHQKIPHQGFPNQYMDMVDNESDSLQFNYDHDMNWGQWQAQVSWQKVDHEMGFFTEEKTGTMPMLTEGKDLGYRLRADINLSPDHVLTIGQEWHSFKLDDWWPAVEGSMMMGPNDFVNINNGKRERLAAFAESELQINTAWQFNGGLRVERVSTDADKVQPYSNMPMMMGMPNRDLAAAEAFNNRKQKVEDTNVDASLLFTWHVSDTTHLEFGAARKTRSPSLYERYSWGRNTMAMTMVGWFGDANGYVGDIDLDPEVAYTLASKLVLSSTDSGRWQLSLAPFYTEVKDYIDAEVIGSFNPRDAMNLSRPLLQLTNLDAKLWGYTLDGEWLLARDHQWLGKLSSDFKVNYQRGERDDDSSSLYQQMPLQVSLGLAQNYDNRLSQRLSVEWVDDKTRVDRRRAEPRTDNYWLLNWQGAWHIRQFTLSVALNNLLDEDYDLPLGGVYYAGWKAGDMSGPFAAMPGQGRNAQFGISYTF